MEIFDALGEGYLGHSRNASGHLGSCITSVSLVHKVFDCNKARMQIGSLLVSSPYSCIDSSNAFTAEMKFMSELNIASTLQ